MDEQRDPNVSVAPDRRPDEVQPRWRRDFPIDWPKDEYRSRRDFTKLLGLTSLAFVAGQTWIVALSVLRRSRGALPEMEIAKLEDIPVGGSRLFHYPEKTTPCVLVRLGTDEWIAFGQQCTHLSCPVIPRPEQGHFRCPCHEGSFDIRTGQPLAGPPRRPLPKIKLAIREGRVFATGLEEAAV